MLLWQNFLSALEQLWANKLRSLLTVLGIVIAVTSTIVVVAVVEGFSGYITNFLRGLGTNTLWVFPEPPSRANFSSRARAEMKMEDLEEVERSCSSLDRLAPMVQRTAKVKFRAAEASTKVMGTTADFQTVRNFYVDLGRCFGTVEEADARRVCVLGRDLLRKLETDDTVVGQTVLIDRQRFTVLGVLERKGSFFGDSQDDIILIPVQTAVRMFPEARNYMGFMAKAATPTQVAESKAQIVDTLRRRHRLGLEEPNDFRIQTQDEILKEFTKVSAVATTVLAGIVGVSLLVGGIGIMNVMLVSVTERTREIGLRKAVGARRRDILLQFLTEAVLLSLLGGLAGVALGYGLVGFASLHPNMVSVSVPGWAVGLAVGFSAFVGVVFGLLPALKAAILQPIDALRSE